MEKRENDFYGFLVGQVADLKTASDELKEVLEFYEATLKTQRRIKLAFKPDLSYFDTKIGQRRNSQGLPFLRPEDIQIDQDLFSALLENIGEIIQSKTEVSVILRKEYLDGQWRTLLRCLMEGSSSLERTAQKMGIDFAPFFFLVVQSFSPFLESYAEKLRGYIDLSGWLRGYCPICGGEPLMARLEKETGRKWLFCSLCYSEWRFRRLECPFCGNNDQESLRYFYLEGEEAYRVDVCDKCKRYTKTIDARKADSIRSLFVEDLATLPLDMVAQKEGFISRGPCFFKEKEV